MNEVSYRLSMDIFQSEHYENFKRVFEHFDKYTLSGAQIYTPELAYQLTEPGVPAVNMATGLHETLPGGLFKQAYIEGFNEGINEFKQRWEPSPEILYGPKSEHFFNDLRIAYEGTMNGETYSELYNGRHNPGWQNQVSTILLIITSKAVRNQGYYAGLVSKYKELELRHEQLRTVTGEEQNGGTVTVKGIILAYYYLRRADIFPIPELGQSGKIKQAHEKIAKIYGVSSKSLKNDWNPLQEKNNRLRYYERIQDAITLLKTHFPDHDTFKAIELARAELNESELRQ